MTQHPPISNDVQPSAPLESTTSTVSPSQESSPTSSVAETPSSTVNTQVNPAPTEMSEAEWEKRIAMAREQRAANATPAPTETTHQEGSVPVQEPPVENAVPSTPAASDQQTQPQSPNITPEMEAIIKAEVERRMNAAAQQQQPPLTPPPSSAADAIQAQYDAQQKAIQDEKIRKAVTEDNASPFIFVSLGTDDELVDAVGRELAEDTRTPEQREADPTPFESGAARMLNTGQKTLQQREMAAWVNHVREANPEALKEPASELRLSRVIPPINNPKQGHSVLSGSAARAAVKSQIQGLYRIQLYNSGFWIDVCPPDLAQIESWMTSIDRESKEMGRYLGGVSYTVTGVLLKKKMCDILKEIVYRSNYEHWSRPDKLFQHISFHDYDTILWGLCCAMYRDGAGIGVYCTNPDCRYVDNSQYLDLTKLCYINTAIFPPECMKFMTERAHRISDTVTDEDLNKYQEMLHFTKTTSVIESVHVSYKMSVPSLYEVVESGAALVGELVAKANGEKNIQSDIMQNQLTFHLFKMFLPWINTLTMYHDDNATVKHILYDKMAIYDSLLTEKYDQTNLYEEIVTFIRDTKIAYHAAHTLKCPKCGKLAELDKDNITPLDMEYIFFGLCCLRLLQNGAEF